MYYLCSKPKLLISCVVTVQLICFFVFANAKHWFSYEVAHIQSIHGLYSHSHHNTIFKDQCNHPTCSLAVISLKKKAITLCYHIYVR